MSGIFEFLLGHKTQEWLHGFFSFQVSMGTAQILGAVAVLFLAAVILYRRTTASTGPGTKAVLIGLKSAALIVVFLCLLQPVLTTTAARPRDSRVVVLIDNSRSMAIRDMAGGRSRGQVASDLLYGSKGLIERLGQKHTLAVHGFDRNVRPVANAGGLSFDGSKTDIAGAMSDAGNAHRGLPPDALILVTDGGDNTGGDPRQMAGILNMRNTPVYVVGIGSAAGNRDVDIRRVTAAATAVEGGVFEVQVTVAANGYQGRRSEVLIESAGNVVATKSIRHGPDGQPSRVNFLLTPETEGARVYTAVVTAHDDERIRENNRMPFLVDNRKRQMNILYVEGHPRNEYKFLRRAAAADKAVNLKTYLKTGPQKFLRQDIETPLELADGYPNDKETLFAYDAVIFGDIPSNFFTPRQLQLTREFVDRRGGGFLMIGGATAFDEGYIGSPIEDLLPVRLVRESALPTDLRGSGRKGSHPTGRKFAPLLTSEGARDALLRLGTDTESNRRLWGEMPELQGINVTGLAKPGATVLAVHPSLRLEGSPLPVLAYQRFGRGRSMAITTATTWRWQMLMPHEDTSHEKLWRQMLRWLAADTPSRVEIVLAENRFSTGDDIQVRARVYNRRFDSVENTPVWLKATAADGAVVDLRMEENIARPGQYSILWKPSQPGLYQLEVSPSGPSPASQVATAGILVTDYLHEFGDVSPRNEQLEHIAREGGGKYYDHNSATRLIRDLERRRETLMEPVQLDVWDMPIVFIFLLACLGLEWMLRRRKGLS